MCGGFVRSSRSSSIGYSYRGIRAGLAVPRLAPVRPHRPREFEAT